jgi:hypothetical protein
VAPRATRARAMPSDDRRERPDFFISYTGADTPWAEWIAWQLEDASYTTRLQAWDFRPGTTLCSRWTGRWRKASA